MTVLRAVEDEDKATLAAIAGGLNPDAWIVAFTLCADGQNQAARRLAAAAPASRIGRLPAGVERWIEQPLGADTRAAWRRAEETYARREHAEANGLFLSLHANANGFLQALCAQRLARTGRALGKDDVAARWREMHAEAEAIGWLEGTRWSAFELGDHQRRAGAYEDALRHWAEEADIETRQGDVVRAARTRMNLGILHAYLGSPRRAAARFEEALPVLEASGDPGWPILLVNTGQLHLRTGEFDRALGVLERARRWAEEAHHEPTLAACALLAGEIHLGLGDPARAHGFFEAAHTAYVRLGDANGKAQALGDQAVAYEMEGRHEEARDRFAETRAHFLAAEEPIQVARTEAGLARLACRLGRAAEAERHGRAAVKAARKHRDRKLEVAALKELARAQGLSGGPEAANRTLAEALEICVADGFSAHEVEVRKSLATNLIVLGRAAEAEAEARHGVRVLGRVFNGLADQESARARESMAGLFDAGMRAAAAQDDPAAFLYFLEGGRAGALLESLSGQSDLRSAAIPDVLRQALDDAHAGLGIARRRLDEARSAGRLEPLRKATGQVEVAERAYAEVHDRLQRQVKAAAGLLFFPEPAKSETIQAALGPQDALVAYALLEARAFACVLTREATRIVDLGSRAALDAALEHASWSEPEAAPPPSAPLKALLVDELQLPPATRRVLLSPDSVLHRVPLALLHDVDEILYVASASTWLHQSSETRETGEGVLAIGDPEYGLRLDRLEHSGEEARGVGTTLLLRAEANEAEVRAALGADHAWRAIHFACHATIDPPHPLHSALELTAAGTDDGRLTAGELFGLRLDADLVTLSACESGTGQYVRGEGLIGLTRALMRGGAPRVLCSLWRVDDEATRVLMTRFYQLWHPPDGSAGLPATVALRRAQQHVRADARWSHPSYWAAWTLWGVFD